MASLIDRIAQKDATLRVPTGQYLDGEPLFDDVPCRVFSLGGERSGEDARVKELKEELKNTAKELLFLGVAF